MKKLYLAEVVGAFMLAIAALVAIACQATVKVQGGKDTPIIHDATVDVTLSAGQPPTLKTEPTDTVPAGTCLRLTFRDAAGNVTGSTETTAGGEEVPVPPGSQEVTISPCLPKAPDKKTKNQQGGRENSTLAGAGEVWFYRSMPIGHDGRGRFVDFTVTAPDHDAADLIAQRFLVDGITQPKPPEVETYGFAFAYVEKDASVLFAMISSTAPRSLQFDWNGRHFANLHGARIYPVRGWYATTVQVPSSLVDVSSFGARNDVSFRLETVGRTLELSSSVEVKL